MITLTGFNVISQYTAVGSHFCCTGADSCQD